MQLMYRASDLVGALGKPRAESDLRQVVSEGVGSKWGGELPIMPTMVSTGESVDGGRRMT